VGQFIDGKVSVGGPTNHMVVPRPDADVVEQDALETMIVSDGPATRAY
jgi:hypothetical protein